MEVVFNYLSAVHDQSAADIGAPRRVVVRKRVWRWLENSSNADMCKGHLRDPTSNQPVHYYGILTVALLLRTFKASVPEATIMQLETLLGQSVLRKITLSRGTAASAALLEPATAQDDPLYEDARASEANALDNLELADDHALVVSREPSASSGLQRPEQEVEVQPGQAQQSRKRRAGSAFADEFAEFAENFRNHSHEELVRELLLKTKQVDGHKKDKLAAQARAQALQRRLRSTQQQLRRFVQAKAKAKAKAKTRASAPGTSAQTTLPDFMRVKHKLEIERTQAGRYLTVPSMVSLGLRRNMSNIAGADLGLVLMDDASRWSVAQAEVRSGASAIASFRSFHEDMMAEMFHEEGLNQGDFNLSLHVVSQDATSGSIWQKRKLCALLLHSAYLTNLSDEARSFRWNWNDMFEELWAIADLQAVDDATGRGSVALTSKMLASIGCPTVHDLVLKHESLRPTAVGRLDQDLDGQLL